MKAIHDEKQQTLVIQKLRKKKIDIMTPILADLIAEGIELGEFKAKYPAETARFLLFGEMGLKHGFKGSINELTTMLRHFYTINLGAEF